MVELSQAKFKEWKVWRVLMGFINVTRIITLLWKEIPLWYMFIVHTGPLFNFFGHKQGKELFQEILWNRGKIVFKCCTQVLDLMINSFFVKGHLFTKINSLPLNTWKSKSTMHVVIMLMTMMIMVMMLKWYSNY